MTPEPLQPTRSRWTRVLITLFSGLLFVFAGLPSLVHAQATDFDPRSWSWNGLGRFVDILQEDDSKIILSKRWDWTKARIQDPVLIIAPQREKVQDYPMLLFVARGGRVLLADDFGTSIQWLRGPNLRLYPRRQAYKASTWQKKKLIDLHMTRPAPHQEADILLRQAPNLFLNHPQWLHPSHDIPAQHLLTSKPHYTNAPRGKQTGKVLFRYPIGHGQLILLSDPSVLINEMLQYGDNQRFAHNLSRYLKQPARSKRVVLLIGDFSWTGEPDMGLGPRVWGLLQRFWEGCTQLNKALTSRKALLAAYPPVRPEARQSISSIAELPNRTTMASRFLFGYLILTLVCLVMWWGWARFAGGMLANQRYQHKREEALRLIPDRFLDQIESYREGHLSYLWPLIILREEVVMFLTDHYHLHHRLRGRDPRESVGMVLDLLEEDLEAGRLQDKLGASLGRLRKILQHLPTRHHWNEWLHRDVRAHELGLYYHDILRCLQAAGLEEDFRYPFLKRPTKQLRPKGHNPPPPKGFWGRWIAWLRKIWPWTRSDQPPPPKQPEQTPVEYDLPP